MLRAALPSLRHQDGGADPLLESAWLQAKARKAPQRPDWRPRLPHRHRSSALQMPWPQFSSGTIWTLSSTRRQTSGDLCPTATAQGRSDGEARGAASRPLLWRPRTDPLSCSGVPSGAAPPSPGLRGTQGAEIASCDPLGGKHKTESGRGLGRRHRCNAADGATQGAAVRRLLVAEAVA
jgi:hypothetical protein